MKGVFLMKSAFIIAAGLAVVGRNTGWAITFFVLAFLTSEKG